MGNNWDTCNICNFEQALGSTSETKENLHNFGGRMEGLPTTLLSSNLQGVASYKNYPIMTHNGEAITTRNVIRGGADDLISEIKDFKPFSAFGFPIKSIGDVVDKGKDVAKDVVDKGKDAIDKGKDLADEGVDNVKDKVEDLIDKGKDVIDKTTDNGSKGIYVVNNSEHELEYIGFRAREVTVENIPTIMDISFVKNILKPDEIIKSNPGTKIPAGSTVRIASIEIPRNIIFAHEGWLRVQDTKNKATFELYVYVGRVSFEDDRVSIGLLGNPNKYPNFLECRKEGESSFIFTIKSAWTDNPSSYVFNYGHYGISKCYIGDIETLAHSFIIVNSFNGEEITRFECWGGATTGAADDIKERDLDYPAISFLGNEYNLVLARTICCFDPKDERNEYKVRYEKNKPAGKLKLGDCCGIIYGRTGVCHQMANRICAAVTDIDAGKQADMLSYIASNSAWGTYGGNLLDNLTDRVDSLANYLIPGPLKENLPATFKGELIEAIKRKWVEDLVTDRELQELGIDRRSSPLFYTWNDYFEECKRLVIEDFFEKFKRRLVNEVFNDNKSALTSAVDGNGQQNIYCLGNDNHVYELAYRGKWIWRDLTADAVHFQKIYEPIATIYEHGEYQGRSQRLNPGKYNISDLAIGNDTLSSLKVPDGMMVTLYEHANFEGNKKSFNTDSSFVGADFNDKTSSILVELVANGAGRAPLPVTGSVLTSAVNVDGKQSVFYLGSNNHVYELAYNGTNWVSIDLTIAGKGQLAAAGSALTTVVIPHGTSIFYLGNDSHVYELAHRGSGVVSVDLTTVGKAPTAATESKLTSAVNVDGKQSVFYLGSNNHVYELAYNGNNWVSIDLTTAGKGQLAASGSVLTTVVINDGTSVFYLGDDNHVYELAHRGTSVVSVDLTKKAGAPDAIARNALTTAVNVDGKQSVFYLGSNNHVYELAYNGNNWVSIDLTTAGKGQLAATGSALTTVVIKDGTSVFYLGDDNHFYELAHRGSSIVSRDLTTDSKPIELLVVC